MFRNESKTKNKNQETQFIKRTRERSQTHGAIVIKIAIVVRLKSGGGFVETK